MFTSFIDNVDEIFQNQFLHTLIILIFESFNLNRSEGLPKFK
jgi:hypothetical protein